MWHKKQNTISFSIVNFFFFYPKYLIPLFHHLVSNCVNIKLWASNFFLFYNFIFFHNCQKNKSNIFTTFASGSSHDFRNLFFISIDGLNQNIRTSYEGLSLILSHLGLPGTVLVNGEWPWLYSLPCRFRFMMLILIRRFGAHPLMPK